MFVLSVCGMGFGTSLMLLMSIQDIAKKKYGLKVDGEACDLSSVTGKKCDLIVASKDIAKELGEASVPIIAINNLVDKKEIEEKCMPIIKQIMGVK